MSATLNFAGCEGRLWDLSKFEDEIRGTVLCKTESVHSGTEHREVKERMTRIMH